MRKTIVAALPVMVQAMVFVVVAGPALAGKIIGNG